MRIVKLLWPVPFTLLLVWASLSRKPALADTPPVILAAPDHPDDVVIATRPLTPSREERLRGYLTRLAYQLSDAVFDRKELSGSRLTRLSKLASDVEKAATTSLPPGDDWKYATTLLWIGHRETRLCSAPRKLGNEDNGRAHGYFQVWAWKGLDPYAPATALDMLVHDAGAWSLPQKEPWIGYPEAAQWIKEHPFE